MADLAEHMHEQAIAGAPGSEARWVEIFTHYFVTQQHVVITTQTGITGESVVIGMNHDSVNTAAIYGATRQIPFAGIEAVQRIGAAEVTLDAHLTRDIGQFAGYMAREEHLRLETVRGVIEEAEVRHIALSGITITDASGDAVIAVPFGDITHTLPAHAQ